jgi:arylsulfatase A-like enzyme
MWAPGRIPAGTTCDALCGTIDLLPTVAALSGSELPTDRKIDGLDISKLLMGSNDTPRQEFLHYASNGNLEGLRQGDYKLLVKKGRGRNNQPAGKDQVMLFNLKEDLGEQNNLASEKPEMVAKLTKRMNELDAEITANQRPTWRKE